MKIGIDARFFGPEQRGLGRYTQKLVEYMEKIDGDDGPNPKQKYFIFLKKANFDSYQPAAKNFQKVLADFHWYTLAEQVKFPWLLRKYKLDLLHFAHFNVPLFYFRPFVTTIHDLILFHYPTVKNTTLNKYFYFIKLAAYQIVIRNAARRAKKVIAVSKFTQEDIAENLKVKKNKIEMIYEGCDFPVRFSGEWVRGHDAELTDPEQKMVLGKYGIMKPYLFYAGGAYPHKNLERLILAFAKFNQNRAEKMFLALAGGRDYFYSRLERLMKKRKIENVKILGFVPDKDLKVLMRQARMYVFPSLYEGFGLPPLEALSQGTPVACSDRTCIREILGDLSVYFDPESVDSIARGIEKALEEWKRKKVSQSDVRKRLKMFDWEQMAEGTLGVYKSVSGEHRN